MTTGEYISFLLFDDFWFVKAFLLLYLFAPMLNLFVNSLSNVILVRLLFAIIQFFHGFIIQAPWFDKGQSPLTMMFLYLLGRYLRFYPCRITKLDKSRFDYLYPHLTNTLAFLV